MRGPMPLTNCRDVSRVSSTSAMLSADSESHGAVPCVRSRVRGTIMIYFQCFPPGLRRPALRQESMVGLVAGFPVELLGAPEPHAAFLNESRTRWCRQRPVTGNPDRPSLSSHVRHCGRGRLSPRVSSATGRNGPTAACEWRHPACRHTGRPYARPSGIPDRACHPGTVCFQT